MLADEPTHKVKPIVVKPGARFSLQRHRRRQEHWYVIAAQAVVTRDDQELVVNVGQAVDLPLGVWHLVRNPGTVDLEFIEVQTGEYFGEDDIERSQDDYGRGTS